MDDLIYFEQAKLAKLDDLRIDLSKPIVPVTVVAANFNNEKYLISFIWSLINGSAIPEEIIIVDDGSLDQSLTLLLLISNRLSNIKIIIFNENKGFANALNVAIEEVKTDYVMRIDPDDISGFYRVELQYEFIFNGNFDFVGTNAAIFDDGTGMVVTETNFPINSTDISKRIYAGEHGVLHPTVMGRTSLFKFYKYRQNFVPAEDYDIFARALKGGARFGNIKSSLLFYRAHSSSSSTNLKYSLIEKTFDLRDSIFGVKTNRILRYKYFVFIFSYRKYLFNKNKFNRLIYGFVAAAVSPTRLLARLFK